MLAFPNEKFSHSIGLLVAFLKSQHGLLSVVLSRYLSGVSGMEAVSDSADIPG